MADSEDALREREAVEAANRVLGETGTKRIARLGGRAAGRLLGALLVATGLAKAAAPQAFGQQVAAYGIVTEPVLVGVIAYAVILLECGLGAALMVRLRPRLTIACTAALFVAFLVAVGHAWRVGSLEDCGCFPWMTRTPREAFFEDLAMLAALGWAYWGQSGAPARTNTAKLVFVGLMIAGAMTTVSVAGVVGPEAPGSAGEPGKETFKALPVSDLDVDLKTGDHLVLLMSTECTHCQAAVPDVNVLSNDSRLPNLVAVATEDRVSRGLFGQDYGAQYPIGQIPKTALQALLKEQFPRLFLVRDGRILAVWDGEKMPAVEEILAKMK